MFKTQKLQKKSIQSKSKHQHKAIKKLKHHKKQGCNNNNKKIIRSMSTTTIDNPTEQIAQKRKQLHDFPVDKALYAANPLEQFHTWFTDVCSVEPIMPERMTISTIKKIPGTNNLVPSSRPVLLKDIIIQDKMISPYGIIKPEDAANGKYPIHQTKDWFIPKPYDNTHKEDNKNIDYNEAVTKHLLQSGGFTFVTNYGSNKAEQIENNSYASLTFHWVELERVVRIEGFITKVPHHLSLLYHNQRPYMSRISALTSNQSRPIESYDDLNDKYAAITELAKKKDWAALGFKPDDFELTQDPANTDDNNEFVPKPKEWGGYVIVPHQMEFWQGKPSRFHQRIVYTRRDLDDAHQWDKEYLQP
eukprot:UN00432